MRRIRTWALPVALAALAAACGAGDSAGAAARPRSAGDRALKEAFASNFLIGAAIEPAQLAKPGDVALLETHFNSITAENVMKPRTLAPTPGVYDDDHTWLSTFPVARTNRPLMFDAAYEAKWSWSGL